MDQIIQIDAWLFTVINGFAGRWFWLDTLARLFLNDYFIPTLLAILLLALWFEGAHPAQRLSGQKAVLVGALAAAAANIILKLINLLYFRPRPFHTEPVNLLFYYPTDPALPSNAAALGFAIAAGVWLYQRRWGWVLLSIAALFAVSRVFGGVHYPLDIVSGAALGIGAAWVVHRQKKLVDMLLRMTIKLNAKLGLP